MVYQPDRERIEKLVLDGFISSRKHSEYDLWILNYTAKAAYENEWNDDTMNCRGLVVDSSYTVVSRPFIKFFNLGQKPMPEDSSVIEVTEKADGSLLQVFSYRGHIIIATRGSFESDQAKWATEWIYKHINLRHLLDWIDYANVPLTLLFEVVYKDNRIVVDYGDFEGLIMIGAIETRTGNDYLWLSWKAIANDLDVRYVKTYETLDVSTLVEQAKTMTSNEEGFVIRFDDQERTRYKIKGDDYLRIHRLLSHITFKHTLEAVASGTYDTAIADVPDEFLIQVKAWKAEIDTEVKSLIWIITFIFRSLPQADRKTFALNVTERDENTPDGFRFTSLARACLFALYDHKDIAPLIYKRAFENRDNQNQPVFKDEP